MLFYACIVRGVGAALKVFGGGGGTLSDIQGPGLRGHAPRKSFKTRVSEMPFPAL